MNTNLYQLKQYRNGSFVKTINPDSVMTDISFTANKNGGQGQLRLTISEPFNGSNYNLSDIIKVYVFNDGSKSGRLLYTGYIQNKVLRATNSEEIELYCIGLIGLLRDIFYTSSGNEVFSKNDTALNILTEIITNFNSTSGQNFTINNEIDLSANIHMDFDHIYCYDAINKVMEFIDGYRYLDASGILNIKSYSIKHKATYKKDIKDLDYGTQTNIYNRLHLIYTGNSHVTYDETTSQGLYGIREKKVTNLEIKDSHTADDYAAQRLADNAYPRGKTKLTITDQYYSIAPIIWDNNGIRDNTGMRNNIYTWNNYGPSGSSESISPGDGIRVNNFIEVIEGSAERITYNNGFVTIDLDQYDSFIKLIKE